MDTDRPYTDLIHAIMKFVKNILPDRRKNSIGETTIKKIKIDTKKSGKIKTKIL